MRIGAAVTSYNDVASLEELLKALCVQSYPLDVVLVIDNSELPVPIDHSKYDRDIVIKHFPENVGVSGALSCAIEWANREKLDWLWMFDQDSKPESFALQALVESLSSISVPVEQIGVLASSIFDSASDKLVSGFYWNHRTFAPIDNVFGLQPYSCDAVINSGSLVNLSRIRMNDIPPYKLFIDGVDFMFCYNLRLRGLKIFVVPSSKVFHKIGTPHLVRIPFRKSLKAYYHLSPLRVFCICRNFSFIELKFAKWPNNLIVVFLRIRHCLYFIIGALFGSEKRWITIRLAVLGTLLGFLGERFWAEKPTFKS